MWFDIYESIYKTTFTKILFLWYGYNYPPSLGEINSEPLLDPSPPSQIPPLRYLPPNSSSTPDIKVYGVEGQPPSLPLPPLHQVLEYMDDLPSWLTGEDIATEILITDYDLVKDFARNVSIAGKDIFSTSTWAYMRRPETEGYPRQSIVFEIKAQYTEWVTWFRLVKCKGRSSLCIAGIRVN